MSQDAGEPVERRFPLYTVEDIENRPPPEWLIEDIIVRDSLVLVYGKPGIGKSFLMVDIAASVAGGVPWQGRPTGYGSVLSIVAEGVGDLGLRTRAWRLAHDVETIPHLRFIDTPVNLFESKGYQADLLASEISDTVFKPDLVIIDTLARSMPGGDENSAKDTGIVIDSAELLRRELGCTVVLVHHSGKDGRVERGSSALQGAVHTQIKLTKAGEKVTMTCEKQKFAAPFEPITMKLTEVPLPDVGGSSCVLVSQGVSEGVNLLSADERIALTLVSGQGMARKDWMAAFVAKSGKSDSTFERIRGTLEDKGLCDSDGSGKGALYQLTPAGEKALGVKVSDGSQRGSDT